MDFFSPNTKLYDIISSNPKFLHLLSRFGIALGFGDHSVKEVCESNHVSTDLFLLICKVYADDSYIPQLADFEHFDMDGLLPYLLQSHRYYMDERFPHLEEHLSHIIKAAQPKYAKLLERFYDEYQSEVDKHFKYEEDTVFPYIEALRAGKSDKHFRIAEFKRNHSNIEDTLDDLMNILLKYLPGDILPKERIEISYDIMELSVDLVLHTRIEERVLIPYVEFLENKKP